jgi:hypothetical protein
MQPTYMALVESISHVATAYMIKSQVPDDTFDQLIELYQKESCLWYIIHGKCCNMNVDIVSAEFSHL